MSDVCISKLAIFTSTYGNARLIQIIDVDLLMNFYRNVSALSVHGPIVDTQRTIPGRNLFALEFRWIYVTVVGNSSMNRPATGNLKTPTEDATNSEDKKNDNFIPSRKRIKIVGGIRILRHWSTSWCQSRLRLRSKTFNSGYDIVDMHKIYSICVLNFNVNI